MMDSLAVSTVTSSYGNAGKAPEKQATRKEQTQAEAGSGEEEESWLVNSVDFVWVKNPILY